MKKVLNEIIEQYEDETFLKADGFDEAIIGVDENTMRLIYSVTKCIEILMRDMSAEDAMEYFSFNVSGGYVGEKTPIWCVDNLASTDMDAMHKQMKMEEEQIIDTMCQQLQIEVNVSETQEYYKSKEVQDLDKAIDLVDEYEKIELTPDELLNLLEEAYRNGYATYELVDAGLEHYDADGYARWVLLGLK